MFVTFPFAKKVLKAVSFDPVLFKKELLKILFLLENKEELEMLKEWCFSEFQEECKEVVEEIFILPDERVA